MPGEPLGSHQVDAALRRVCVGDGVERVVLGIVPLVDGRERMRTARRPVEIAADAEHGVADRLSVEPAAGAAAQELVLGVGACAGASGSPLPC